MMLSRRDCLRGGLSAALAAAVSGMGVAAAKKKIPIGLQVYSVREAAAKDLAGVLKAIGQMGYEGV